MFYRMRMWILAHVTMYLFCPHCGNLLVVEEGPSTLRFACNTCPYVQNISEKVAMKVGHLYNVYRLLCCVCVYHILTMSGIFSPVPKVERSG